MNPRSLLAGGTLIGLAAMTFSIAPAHAGGRCDDPRTMIDVRACQAGAQGPDSLRRFVERTRGIYGLSYYDFARDETPAPARATAAEQSTPKS